MGSTIETASGYATLDMGFAAFQQVVRPGLSVDGRPAQRIDLQCVSIWEVAIKRALGRKEFNVDPRVLRRGLIDNAYSELGFTSEHALAIEGLPAIHKDSFDRALIAQAMSEGIVLLTADSLLEGYSGVVREV